MSMRHFWTVDWIDADGNDRQNVFKDVGTVGVCGDSFVLYDDHGFMAVIRNYCRAIRSDVTLGESRDGCHIYIENSRALDYKVRTYVMNGGLSVSANESTEPVVLFSGHDTVAAFRKVLFAERARA